MIRADAGRRDRAGQQRVSRRSVIAGEIDEPSNARNTAIPGSGLAARSARARVAEVQLGRGGPVAEAAGAVHRPAWIVVVEIGRAKHGYAAARMILVPVRVVCVGAWSGGFLPRSSRRFRERSASPSTPVSGTCSAADDRCAFRRTSVHPSRRSAALARILRWCSRPAAGRPTASVRTRAVVIRSPSGWTNNHWSIVSSHGSSCVLHPSAQVICSRPCSGSFRASPSRRRSSAPA